MGGLLAGLVGLAAPFTARVLMALGFSVVTITGVAVAWATVRDEIVGMLGAQAGAYVQLVGLGGGWIAIGTILGGMAFAVSMWTLTRAVRILGV